MNEGVELLLKRMESHPEEFQESIHDFIERDSKWDRIMYQVRERVQIMDIESNAVEAPDPNRIIPVRQHKPLPYLSDEEIMTIYNKLIETQRDMFVRQVMAQLLREQPEDGIAEDSGVTLTSTAYPRRIVHVPAPGKW